jgi:phytoene synthase
MADAHKPDPGFNFAYCEGLVRDGDPDRYWASLFAPADKRPHLHALYAFSFEIARVRDSVREAMVGEIRLQWWRDALQGEARGDVRANPVAAALDDTIVRFRLPRQALVDLVDARVFDLYEDLMPSLNDLEGYCGETSSSLVRLAGIVLADGRDPGAADAAGHAGVAYAITGLLRAFPWHARKGQVYIPQDVLARHGVVREDIVRGRGGPGLVAALADMRAVARHHLGRARALKSTVPPGIRPAFQPLALVEPYLKAMERRDYDPFASVVDIAQWRRLAALWRGPF